MVGTSDILIIGGGVAGLSVAAELSTHASVAVLEAEEQIGFHSSGRSATMLHYALGDRLVRALTLASRSFFETPPDGFSDVPLGERRAVLIHAREDEKEALNALGADISVFAELEWVDEVGLAELCPLLKTGEGGAVAGLADLAGIRLDAHALLQGFLRQLRSNGGQLHARALATQIDHRSGVWRVTCESGAEYSAPILVNAAGSWADHVARLAGVQPLGLVPMRRTIITFDAPPRTDLDRLPFTKTVGDELYFAPESGRLFASPMDEVPTEPSDAQPDEYEIALAAWRMEERTTVKVNRVHSSWAGLRTFAADRHPVVGFAPDADSFFWLAGQGGFGLQTSAAMARITASIIAREAWPVAGVSAEELSPGRFARHLA
jgi:D-arginine dehydrogenase